MTKKLITKDEWEKKLAGVKIRKADMNKLVMNYFVTEGYVDAAEKFRLESGTEHIDLGTITDRMLVKKAVIEGNVQEAIEKVNDLNPEILDTNPQIFFHLQQQRLIELIRQNDYVKALEFAQEELAPRGEENPIFLEELERTVALLVFDDAFNCPVKELMDPAHRNKTASEVNAAILTSQNHEKDVIPIAVAPRANASQVVEDADLGSKSTRSEGNLSAYNRSVWCHSPGTNLVRFSFLLLVVSLNNTTLLQ